MDKPDYVQDFSRGIFAENPLLRLVLGICPSLAVSAAVESSFWMGLAVLFVLMCSAASFAVACKYIPVHLNPRLKPKLRMLGMMAIIAFFVTLAELFMRAYLSEIHQQFGIYVPLIAVNCFILSCIEINAPQNQDLKALLARVLTDKFGMGVGYMGALMLLATLREVFGAGTFYGQQIFPASFPVIGVLVQPPGAFIALGLLLGIVNFASEHFRNPKQKG